MGNWIFAGSGSNNLSSLTYGEAKSMASEIVGGQKYPDRVNAASALKRARRWLLRENWHYLQVKGTGIVIPASASEVDLPMPIRSIVSVKVGTSAANTFLDYLPISQINRQTSDSAAGVGGTRYYTFVGWQKSGKIQLIDPWTSTPGVMDIWYSRPIDEPVNDNDTLDLLEGPMELAYLDMGSYYIGVMAGAKSSDVDRFAASATAHYAKARGMDKTVYGAILGFLPQQVWDQPANLLRRGPRPPRAYSW